MSETPEPTFEELRQEAISSVYKLVNANQGAITPQAVLHLGMFFGELNKHLRDESLRVPRENLQQQLDANAEDAYQQAHEVINQLEHHAEEYGDYRLAAFSEEDAQILRNALEVLHDR
jgi:predicted DNA-binding protein